MRRISNGHSYDMTCVEFDFHLSLIATADVFGEIAIWDYETSSFMAFLLGHNDPVQCVKFLSPKPLLLSAGSDGKVCIWTLRPVPFAQRHVCLYNFFAKTVDFSKNEDGPCNITAI